jgi:hypothetical protein
MIVLSEEGWSLQYYYYYYYFTHYGPFEEQRGGPYYKHRHAYHCLLRASVQNN